MVENLARELLATGAFVRYVAVGEGQRVTTVQRNGLENPSASDSDRTSIPGREAVILRSAGAVTGVVRWPVSGGHCSLLAAV